MNHQKFAAICPPNVTAGVSINKAQSKQHTLSFEVFNWPSIFNHNHDIKEEFDLYNRIKPILNKLGVTEDFIYIDNIFSQRRLRQWIQHNSQIISLNGHIHTYQETPGNDLELWCINHNSIAKLKNKVFLFHHGEDYLNLSHNEQYIIFIGDQWNSDTIKNFILEFSKELSTFSTQHPPYRDLHAFDSVFLPDEIITDLKEDIENFLRSRKIYKEDLGLAYKRGYLFIGPPGQGKTLTIRKICDYYGLEHFDIKQAIHQDGSICLDKVIENWIDYTLYPDVDHPKVCILEDIDKFTAFQSGEVERDVGSVSLHALLKGLDGVDEFNDLILIATTNFADTLHEAIAGRPGRFDKIYSFEYPKPREIEGLLNYHKISISEGSKDWIIKSLEGFSMAFVAEFIKSAKMKYKRNELSKEEAIILLAAIQKHKDLCESHFKEVKRIGF